jgi:hypothetical protein
VTIARPRARRGAAGETRPCKWCGRPFPSSSGAGRPREFCRRSCRQRAYEARRRADELGLGEHELVIARDELESLRDRLYVLGCALEDVERDVDERSEAAEVREALAWLVDASKQAVEAMPAR